MSYSLQLRRFDMKWIQDDSVVLILGRRNTGKSYLAKDYLYHHKDIPTAVVISGTECENKFYSQMIPSLFIYDEYQPQIIDNFVKRQRKITRLQRQNPNIDNRALIIFDDLMDDAPVWSKDKNVKKIYILGRHRGIGHINILQYIVSIPPSLRTNVDYIFILREPAIQNRKKIYDMFAGMFPDFASFSATMDACTENYECMVIHNNAKSNKIEDQVFWYKAEDHGDFRIGPKEIWDYCAENCIKDTDSEDEEEEININTYNKRCPKLNITKI